MNRPAVHFRFLELLPKKDSTPFRSPAKPWKVFHGKDQKQPISTTEAVQVLHGTAEHACQDMQTGLKLSSNFPHLIPAQQVLGTSFEKGCPNAVHVSTGGQNSGASPLCPVQPTDWVVKSLGSGGRFQGLFMHTFLE